jgi:hypothetical protein
MLTIAGGAIAYLIVNRKIKQGELNKILNEIETGVSSEKVQTGNIDAFNPLYWKNTSLPKLSVIKPKFTGSYAQGLAKKIKGYIGYANTPSDEESLKALFRQFSTQQEVSLVADYYYQLYKKDMKEDIKTIDYSFLGLNDGTDATQIFEMVSKLKKY